MKTIPAFNEAITHLQIIYDSLDILDIYPSVSHQKYPFNLRTIKVYLSYWLTNISLCVYFSRDARDFVERLDIVFRISLAFLFWFSNNQNQSYIFCGTLWVYWLNIFNVGKCCLSNNNKKYRIKHKKCHE